MKPSTTSERDLVKENRNLRKHLKELSGTVSRVVNLLDAEMKVPSDHGRGRRIAAIVNSLEFANDSAKHFGLGLKLKRKKCGTRSTSSAGVAVIPIRPARSASP